MRAITVAHGRFFLNSDKSESLTVALLYEQFWAKERRAKEQRAIERRAKEQKSEEQKSKERKSEFPTLEKSYSQKFTNFREKERKMVLVQFILLFFNSSWCKIATVARAKHWINSVPPRSSDNLRLLFCINPFSTVCSWPFQIGWCRIWWCWHHTQHPGHIVSSLKVNHPKYLKYHKLCLSNTLYNNEL